MFRMVSSTLSDAFLNLLTYLGGGPRCSGRRGSAAEGFATGTEATGTEGTEATEGTEGIATEATEATGTEGTDAMGRAWGFPYPERPVSRSLYPP